jgi:hypothetical protein
MTERELITQAKILYGNCISNGDKISFADACKITLLARILEAYSRGDDFDGLRLYKGLRAVLPWWKRLFFRFNF